MSRSVLIPTPIPTSTSTLTRSANKTPHLPSTSFSLALASFPTSRFGPSPYSPLSIPVQEQQHLYNYSEDPLQVDVAYAYSGRKDKNQYGSTCWKMYRFANMIRADLGSVCASLQIRSRSGQVRSGRETPQQVGRQPRAAEFTVSANTCMPASITALSTMRETSLTSTCRESRQRKTGIAHDVDKTMRVHSVQCFGMMCMNPDVCRDVNE